MLCQFSKTSMKERIIKCTSLFKSDEIFFILKKVLNEM